MQEKGERKMKKILLSIFVLGFIFGIIPMLIASFIGKHVVLFGLLIVINLIWLKKELCE